jgi:CBS domain-containing protein
MKSAMRPEAAAAIDALNRRYLTDYPREAARHLEELPSAKAADVLAQQPVHVIVPVWQHLSQDMEERVLASLSDKLRSALLAELEPSPCAALLNRLDPETRARYLAPLNPEIAKELGELMLFPPDTAGQLMDPRVIAFRADRGAREALTRLRRSKSRALREIYVTDEEGRLSGRVEMQDLALAEPSQTLADIARHIVSAVQSLTPREEVVEILEQYKLPVLPVVDISGRLVGVIHQAGLLTALQEETSLDIQTMVGASKDERALSKVPFARYQAPALVADKPLDRLSRRFGCRTVREHHRPVHGAGSIDAGRGRAVRQCRGAGAGGDHARSHAARNRSAPLGTGGVQGGQRRIAQRTGDRGDHGRGGVFLEPILWPIIGARHFNGTVNDRSRFLRRRHSDRAHPHGPGPGTIVVHRVDHRD